MLIHRRSLNGKARCLSVTGGLSNTAGPVYAVKCDHCKQFVTFTYDIHESYAGILCRSCNL
jgi:hypothetical protein